MKIRMMTALKIIIVFFACIGLYRCYLFFMHSHARTRAEAIEAKWQWDPVLKYNLDGGEPLFLVNLKNRVSMIFLEGFRTQNPAGMYREYFEGLHKKSGVNIFVPVYGIQSSPFHLRYRDWHKEEDMRTVLMAYEDYLRLAKRDRRVDLTAAIDDDGHAAIEPSRIEPGLDHLNAELLMDQNAAG